MITHFNTKVILCVLLISVVSFSSHKLGLLNTSHSVSDSQNYYKVEELSMGKSIASISRENDLATVECRLLAVKQFNLCGLSYQLSPNMNQGKDLSIYDRVELLIDFEAPEEKPSLKFTFRNYNENYAKADDFVSLKFNSITYRPADYPNSIVVPFSAFQVDNWWIKQYKVDFNNSYFDVSNVGFIEILAQNLPQTGNYRIKVKSITLYGELISEQDFLKLILTFWFIVGVFLIIRQRNILSRLSSTDMLTGALNRRGIKKYIEQSVLPSRDKNSSYLVCIDIDNFKKINDTFGHSVGDEVLIRIFCDVNRLLEQQFRKKYQIACLSGDEFCILLHACHIEEAEKVILHTLAIYQQEIALREHKIFINLNVGATQINEETTTFEAVLLRTDSALHYAKKKGVSNYQFFDKTITNEIYFQKSILENLKLAIDEHQFELHFMPIVESSSLLTRRVEVLLRSQSQTLKTVGPDVFIPIAEQYGLIEEIDFMVIESTFKQLASSNYLNLNPTTIFCINISASELNNYKFANKFKMLLSNYDIDPKRIELEITETSLIEIDDRSISLLHEIKKLGVNLALDDFGTGYTAFNQLLNYPVDCLKIDKSFVDKLCMPGNTRETMITAIISIAKSYQLHTIAEGVETEQQAKALNDLGCDMLQGYYFSKPLPWPNLVQYLADEERRVSFKSDLRNDARS